MKKTETLFWLLSILFVTGCSKKDNGGSSPSVSISVTDLMTSTKVSGATVSLRRCASLGCVFGIVEEFKGQTDHNGTVSVPQDKYDKIPDWNEATQITSPDYWPEIFKKATSFSITPYGWMRLRIIRGSNYPPGSRLLIRTNRQIQPPNSAYGGYSDLKDFNAAADSSLLIKGFGNHLNKIDWQVYDPSGAGVVKSGSWNQQIPKLDTIKNITLNY